MILGGEDEGIAKPPTTVGDGHCFKVFNSSEILAFFDGMAM